jgi:hypothetical protein
MSLHPKVKCTSVFSCRSQAANALYIPAAGFSFALPVDVTAAYACVLKINRVDDPTNHDEYATQPLICLWSVAASATVSLPSKMKHLKWQPLPGIRYSIHSSSAICSPTGNTR